MKKSVKISFFISVVVLFAGFFSAGLAEKLKTKNNAVSVPDFSASRDNILIDSERATTEELCPELFTKSADEYLASEEVKNDKNTKCYVSGCGGVF